MVNIVFFGSSPFSVIVPEKLLASKIYDLASVVTTPDKPAGRHLKLTPNPVKLLAQKHNIPVYTDIHDFLATDIPPKTVGLVAAHGRRLGPKTLSKFNNQVYVIHPSLLPKYRGPSPLQQQILDGITETGVTIIQADPGEDTGPIIASTKDIILPSDTWITLGNRLFELGANWFIENSFQISKFKFQIQDDSLATYTQKLTRQSGFISWEKFESGIMNQESWLNNMFRAYFEWPGIWTTDPTGNRLKLISLNPIMVEYEGQKPQPWPIQQLPKN